MRLNDRLERGSQDGPLSSENKLADRIKTTSCSFSLVPVRRASISRRPSKLRPQAVQESDLFPMSTKKRSEPAREEAISTVSSRKKSSEISTCATSTGPEFS